MHLRARHVLAALTATVTLGLAGMTPVAAATTEVISPPDVTPLVEDAPIPAGTHWGAVTRQWVGAKPANGPAVPGTVSFRSGPGTPPLGTGSAELSTPNTNSKVQLFNYDHVGEALSSVTAIKFSSNRSSGTGQQNAAINLEVDFNGPAAGGFTTLVWEPIYNTAQGAITNGVWKTWDAMTATGKWWSSSAINGQCAGAGVSCWRSWSQIVTNNPAAVVTRGVGINQGSGNPTLVTAVDAFVWSGTTYDFEVSEDADGDGVQDGADNCVSTPNADQADADHDSVGDACDSDSDGDGVANASDNCPTVANADQADLNGTGGGDACDGDDDGDAVPDTADNCPRAANAGQEDTDGDGIGDACDPDDDGDGIGDDVDNCPSVANGDQVDLDGDGIGDACDPDDDGDAVADSADNCPAVANADQLNTDGDSAGDACDPDDDGDTVADGADNCPVTANPAQADLDGDGIGDACDPDDDADGVGDAGDNCPATPNASQADADHDGIGDPCDPDDDGNGIADTPPPTTKDQCKNDGWKAFDNPSFKNQGDCVSFVATGGRH